MISYTKTQNKPNISISVMSGSFEQALAGIKLGELWSREGFHGRKKWIKLWHEEFKPGLYVDNVLLSHLVLEYEDGRITPWTPTRCDILENDWYKLSYDA